MSSIQRVILNLISGIEDPSIRMEVGKTITYLYSVYESGEVRDDEIRRSLEDVVDTIVRAKHPELEKDERRAMVRRMVDEIMQAFRLQSIFRRTAGRRRGF